MPTLNLTDRKIRSLKASSTRVEYVDLKVPGLALRVMPTGAKSWTLHTPSRPHAPADARDAGQDSAGEGARACAERVPRRHHRCQSREPEAGWPQGRDRGAARRPLHREVGQAQEALVESRRQPPPAEGAPEVATPGNHRHHPPDVRALVESVAEAGAPVVANRVAALLSKVFSLRWIVICCPSARRPGSLARPRSTPAIAC